MVASIGAVAAPEQGASYYERDGYYAKDDVEHRQASAWAGRGAAGLGLEGPVDPDTFRAVLEGRVPDGSGKRLGRVGKDGEFHHRPGRDLTFSAPKSVSLAALVGGDARVIDAHDRAVGRALDWFERNAAETRMKDPETGRMMRTGGQKTVIATFRHDASRNLDPALHTHSVIANMVRGDDGKWRTMANERLYASKMLLGALYRNELAGELAKLGYGIEKTHADGRFEIAGVPRSVIEAYSTRRAEIEAAMAERGLGGTAENQRLAQRAALFTRAAKRDVDRAALQAAGMKTAVMDEIMRQRDPVLKEAVEASLAGEIGRAFEKLSDNIAEAKPDNLAGAAAARWLALSPDDRANTGLMAPSHGLRERINEIVRERLVRDGAVHGPAMNAERLVSRGYSNAEKTLAANYAPGDTVAFHRSYKRLGVDKGDELRVLGVDRRAHTVTLQGKGGREVSWDPNRLAARAGGVEVYRAEEIEFRAGDRIRWTRNDMGLGLVNSGIAEVAAVRDGRVTFRLEDGRMLDLRPGDPQLGHVDRAWASTVHAFQGRTVDNVIAAMESNHAKLTTQKSFYVEISRARDRAELVTDDRSALSCAPARRLRGSRSAPCSSI